MNQRRKVLVTEFVRKHPLNPNHLPKEWQKLHKILKNVPKRRERAIKRIHDAEDRRKAGIERIVLDIANRGGRVTRFTLARAGLKITDALLQEAWMTRDRLKKEGKIK